MEKKIAKNYLYNAAYQILTLVIPLITTPYISRVLGVNNVGIYSYVATVASYFVIFSQVGLNLFGQRQVSYDKDNPQKLANTFKQLVCIRLITFFIGICVYVVLILNAQRYRCYYLIFLIQIIAGAIDITWFFQGLEDFRAVTIRNFIIKFTNTICIFIFVKTPNDLAKYIAVYCISELVSQSIMWVGVKKKLVYTKTTLNYMPLFFKGALVMFLPQAITTIYTLSDKLVLGLLSNETQVGLYSQSEKIVKLSLTVIGAMGTVMMPRIANIYANGKHEEVVHLLNKTRNFVFFAGLPMMFGLFGIANNFTAWFFGQGYEPVSYLMVVMSPIIILIGLSDLYGMQFLVPTGHMKEYTISAAVGAAINVVLNVALTKQLGAAGVSIATVVSELFVAVSMWYFSRPYIKLSSAFPKLYLLGALIMGVVVKLIDSIAPGGVLWTIIEILIGVGIYMLVLYFGKDDFLLSAKNAVLRKFKKS